jgi:hypothetical protein
VLFSFSILIVFYDFCLRFVTLTTAGNGQNEKKAGEKKLAF